MVTSGAVVLVFDLNVLAVDNLFKRPPILLVHHATLASALGQQLSELGVAIEAKGSQGADERFHLQQKKADDIFAGGWVLASLADLGEAAGGAIFASSSRTGRFRNGLKEDVLGFGGSIAQRHEAEERNLKLQHGMHDLCVDA